MRVVWTISGLILLLAAATRIAHAQVDPRCGDRTAQGAITCVIDKPVVNQRETIYSNVAFSPGDVVRIGAGGCVQTGGLGNTWKLYVNPSGPNADHLYHGLIEIPSVTSGLVRIGSSTIANQNLAVTGVGVNTSDLVLHLGYEDDNYSDNGYNSHDDGTQDQCKNIGNAQVRVVIYRGVPPPPPENGFDFDLVSTSAFNGIPLDPQWTWQARPENAGAIPDSALCHNFAKTVELSSSPPVFVSEPSFADCTDQTNLSNVDQPSGFNSFICSFGSTNSFIGHLNWFPIAVHGHAGWGDHGTDDDYTFEFTADNGNPLSVNGRSGLHTEFDSDETIDNFHTSEWDAFHTAVDQTYVNGPTGTIVNKGPAEKLFDGETYLTGMFGLDCEHDCKGEIHPLYALATLRDNYENSPDDETWLMFVRNNGDEGYCSNSLWQAPFRTYTFRLRWLAGMTSVQVLWGINETYFEGSAGTSGPTVTFIPPPATDQGVYVTFTLPDPSTRPLIDGALHLKWSGRPGLAQARQSHLSSQPHPAHPVVSVNPTRLSGIAIASESGPAEIDEAEQRLAAAINAMPAPQRQIMTGARSIAGSRTALRPLPAGQPARQISSVAVLTVGAPTMTLRLIGSRPVATRKAALDAAQMQALCKATNNAPAGLPSGVCPLTFRRLPPR